MRELACDGARVEVVAADVSDQAQVRAAFDAAAERVGGLDFLVSNAGIRRIAPFLDDTLEDWRQVTGAGRRAPTGRTVSPPTRLAH